MERHAEKQSMKQNSMKICTWPFWVLLSLVILYSPESNAHDFTMPTHRNDGWETSTLEKENVSAEPLDKLINDVEKGL